MEKKIFTETERYSLRLLALERMGDAETQKEKDFWETIIKKLDKI